MNFFSKSFFSLQLVLLAIGVSGKIFAQTNPAQSALSKAEVNSSTTASTTSAAPKVLPSIPFKQFPSVAQEVLNALKEDKISEKEADFQKMIYFATIEELSAEAKKAGLNLYDYVISHQAQKSFINKVAEHTKHIDNMKEIDIFILLAKTEAEHSVIFNNLEPEQKEVNQFIEKVSKKLGIE